MKEESRASGRNQFVVSSLKTTISGQRFESSNLKFAHPEFLGTWVSEGARQFLNSYLV